MPSTPEISVVMITCDRIDQLANALDTLQSQKLRAEWSYEIVVVDDGSKDGTAELLRNRCSSSPVPLRFVSTKGVGVPAARNLAAEMAQGRWLASFDDDQLAPPHWLEELHQAAEITGAQCFGGALALSLPAGTALESLGPRVRILLGEHLLSDRLGLYPAGESPATNNAFITRELFWRVDGFDTSFQQGGSDTDFFERVKGQGQAIWFVPAACALHVIPAARLTRNYYRWVSRKVAASRVRILRKRSSGLPLIKFLLLRAAVLLFRDLPVYSLSRLLGNVQQTTNTLCSMWFTSGLFRGAWSQRSAKAEQNAAFLKSLDFRRHGGERGTPAA